MSIHPSIKRLFSFGLTSDLSTYRFYQGIVFNLLTFSGVLLTLLREFYIILNWEAQNYKLVILVNLLPLLFCFVLILLMYFKKYKSTIYLTFILMPVLIGLMSVVTNDRAALLFYFPTMLFLFYFLNRKRKILISFVVTALLFLVASFFIYYKNNLQTTGIVYRNFGVEMISLVCVIIFTFLSLYCIKTAIWNYQNKIFSDRKLLQSKKQLIETQFEQLQKSNAVNVKLFSIISHDLRSPIAALSSILEMGNNDKKVEIISRILPELNEEVKKTAYLFNNLIRWSKIQLNDHSFKPIEINLAQLGNELYTAFQSEVEKKRLHFENILNVKCVFFDYDIMTIVLRNLISNAIKFTPANGAIKLCAKELDENVIISICDNGKGISTEDLNKIMAHSFYTTPGTDNEQGTGLGLIICNDLIERSGGYMKVTSEVGKGTVIELIIPKMVAVV